MSSVLPILLATARAEPDRLALIWNNQELSYSAFVTRIAAARARFAGLGLTPGRVAAILINHLTQSWIAALALQSLGVVTVAVRVPEELEALELPELEYLVTHSSETIAGLAQSGRADRLRHIHIEPFTAEELTIDLSQVELPAAGGHILSTSGTTGVYKRVLIDPERQRIRTEALKIVCGAPPDAVSYFGGLGIWTAAGYGGPMLVWAHRGAVVLDQRMPRYLSFTERRITYATLIPPELEAILDAPEGALTYNPELEIYVIGGALPWRLAEKAISRLTPKVITLLATTEVVAFGSTQVRGPGDQLAHVLHPSREVQVVDEAGAPLPTGEVGLVRVRILPGDVDGYMNDDAVTQAFFRDGFFYPGDLGAMREDGRLTLEGRANDVINVRGLKIATLPIEHAIQGRIGAKGVCILLKTEGDGEESLHMFVELERELTQADRALLESVSPDWKPHIHQLDRLPRNDMGKINRIELRRRLRDDGGRAREAAG